MSAKRAPRWGVYYLRREWSRWGLVERSAFTVRGRTKQQAEEAARKRMSWPHRPFIVMRIF